MDEITHDDDRRQGRELPTTNRPLNSPGRRPLWKPLLLLLAFLVALFLIYLFGVAVLVPAD